MKPVIIVSGLGRCGSSLLMQILEAVGYPVTGPYPSFEDERTGIGGFDADWITQQSGIAVKILTPNCPDIQLPDSLRTKTIWLNRNAREQSKSTGKFLSIITGMPVTRSDIKGLAKNSKEERRVALAKLTNHGPILEIWFEGLINKETKTFERICDYLQISRQMIDKMKAVVLPRTTACTNGLEIEIGLITERENNI